MKHRVVIVCVIQSSGQSEMFTFAGESDHHLSDAFLVMMPQPKI